MLKLSTGLKGSILKVILLMIFVLYTCSITFFTHSHIIGGVTIVHSHFYKTDAEGNPTHEHTGSEIQLINNLSTYFSVGIVVLAILIGLLSTQFSRLFFSADSFHKEDSYQEQLRLRAPPFYSFI